MNNNEGYLKSMKAVNSGGIAASTSDDTLSSKTSTRALKDNMRAVSDSYSNISNGVDNFIQTYYINNQKLYRNVSADDKALLTNTATTLLGKPVNFTDDFDTFRKGLFVDASGKDLPLNKKVEVVQKLAKNLTSIDSPYVTFKPQFVSEFSNLIPIAQSIKSESDFYKLKATKIKKTNDVVMNTLSNKYAREAGMGNALENTITSFVRNDLGQRQQVQASPELYANRKSKLNLDGKDAIKYMIFEELKNSGQSGFLLVGDTNAREKAVESVFNVIKNEAKTTAEDFVNTYLPDENFIKDMYVNKTLNDMSFMKEVIEDSFDELKEEYIKTYSEKGTSLMQNPETGGRQSTGAASENHTISVNTGIADDGYVAFTDVMLDAKENPNDVIYKFEGDENKDDPIARAVGEYIQNNLLTGRDFRKDKSVPSNALNTELTFKNIADGNEDMMSVTFTVPPMYLIENKNFSKYLAERDPEAYEKLVKEENNQITLLIPKDKAKNLYYQRTLPTAQDALLNSTDLDNPGLNLSNNSGSFISIKKQEQSYNLDVNLKYISGIDDNGKIQYDSLTYTNQTVALPPEGFYDGKLIYDKYNQILSELEKINYEILQSFRKSKKKGKVETDAEKLKAWVSQRLMGE